ncbi:MAG TPA: hypothetical protein RMG95_17410, partial [Polyangiaceae bacterium LLY-WYZ-15_(1-7)]|nr:hypothetical protein [Polyangiaceae bacterium LLY-WYZ-15_(1-7)]
MSDIAPELRRQVEAWIAEDPDPTTREELQALLDAGDAAELADRFRGPLRFGTAGLRGLLGGGPNRMNRVVVLRATAGLCAYLKAHVTNAAERGVCIGFDGRRMSRQLATDVAEVVTGMGLKARVYDTLTPTPLVAFSVLDQGAAAGVVVTASHNPPDYNGYKVYWGNGAQIVPPHDAGIAAAIDAVGPVAEIPRMPRAEAEAAGRIVALGEADERAYLAGVKGLALHPETPRELRIAYTAMHGVGGRFVHQALADQGFSRVFGVPEQAEPDGAFPTVAFPNPEEDGAMDLVLALAEKEGADLVLANDPDADRLAVSIRHGGAYVALSGNEIGCLLAHYLLEEGPQGPNRLVVESVVSSPMLLAIGAAHGARGEQTLTGHKWIQNRGLELEAREGLCFVFGYEEALGYAVGALVRDKDGISAAVLMADLAAWCASEGRTVIDELERAWRRYGMYLSEQVSVVLPGADGAAKIASLGSYGSGALFATAWWLFLGMLVGAHYNCMDGWGSYNCSDPANHVHVETDQVAPDA